MRKQYKATGKASSVPAGLAAGAAMSLTTTILGAAIVAKLIDGEYLKSESTGYAVMIVLLLSSYLGAIISAERIKRQRLAVCLLSALIYFGALMGITALFFGGQYAAVGVTGLLTLGGSITAILTGKTGSRGGKRRKNRMINC